MGPHMPRRKSQKRGRRNRLRGHRILGKQRCDGALKAKGGRPPPERDRETSAGRRARQGSVGGRRIAFHLPGACTAAQRHKLASGPVYALRSPTSATASSESTMELPSGDHCRLGFPLARRSALARRARDSDRTIQANHAVRGIEWFRRISGRLVTPNRGWVRSGWMRPIPGGDDLISAHGRRDRLRCRRRRYS